MPITLNGTTGITTPGLINTGSTTFVDLTTTGNTILGDASTDTLNVANGNLVLNSSGNLGIGTASPASKLHIQSATGTAETLIKLQTAFSNPSGNKSIVWADNSNTLGAIAVNYSAPQTSMTFGSLYNSGYNTTDLMTLTPTGLGVGTASPSARLHAVVDGAGESDIARFSRTNGADLHFLDIGVNADTNFVIFDSSGSAAGGYTFRRGGTDAMTLDASGNLAVGASSVPRGRVYINSGASANTLAIQSSATGTYLEFADVTTPTWANSPKVGGINNDLVFSTSGSERARIDSSGRLLVGTTSSIGTATVSKLQVLGGGTFVTTNSEAGGFVGVNSNADNSLAIAADFDNLRAGSHIAFFVDGFSEKARIDSSGNLLVGTTSTSGAISNGTAIIGGIFRTATASVSASNNTATTIITLPTGIAFYLVNAFLSADDAVNYSATALIQAQGGTSLVTTTIRNGNLLSISNSGYNVRVTQNSGTNTTVFCSVTRIG